MKFLLILLFCHCSLFAGSDLKAKMLRELDVIYTAFDARYAPKEWKESYNGWNLEREIEVAREKVRSPQCNSLKDFHIIVKQLLKTTNDYHVKVNFRSSEHSVLPFRVQRAEGHYYVTWVNSVFCPGMYVGDEILAIDGQPIDRVIEGLKRQELGTVDSPTEQALAEMFLTFRAGQLGQQVPKGSLVVDVKNEIGFEKSLKVNWLYTGEQFSDAPFVGKAMLNTPPKRVEKRIWGIYSLLEKVYKQDPSSNPIGHKNSILPELGIKVWENKAESPFEAYIYLNQENQPIGFIRIPHYSGNTKDAKEFSRLINLFEKETEMLVIDQLNNPGGSLCYLLAVLSMLSPYPLDMPKERISMIQEDVAEAFEELERKTNSRFDPKSQKSFMLGYPLNDSTQQSLRNYAAFIVEQWNSGKTISDLTHLQGVAQVEPHPWGCYSKPLLVLTNALDFSCADLLPAILQDNKRAIIFGTKTAGAGGAVREYSFPNLLGVASYSLTSSIAERVNGEVLENNGVKPDVEYEATAVDLQGDYVNYIELVNRIVHEMSFSLSSL